MSTTTDGRLLAGRYRLGERLGRGGMGVVWAARDEVLARDVAVKEIVPPAELAEEDRDRLRRRTLREARAAARISSRAALTVFDVVEEDGRPWIVMEHVSARSLADVLRTDGPLEPAQVVQVGLDVLEALEAASAAGVLHRDVKPSNVLVRQDGTAVLADFGIATLEGDSTLTTTGVVLGSPAYMSPERARGERPTLACDLWSLGATLFAAIEGRPPFDGDGPLQTLRAVLDEPSPRPGGDPRVADAVVWLLQKEASARPSIREARTALQAAAEPIPSFLGTALGHQQPAPAELPTGERTQVVRVPRPPGTRSRRRRTALAVLVALVLLGLGTLVVREGWLPGRETPTATDDGTDSGEEQRAGGAPTVAGTALPDPTAGPSQSTTVPTPAATPTTSATSPAAAGAGGPAAGAGGAAAAAFQVPAGFTLHTDPTGFVVAVPDGWVRTVDGPRTDFREPGTGRFLRVDQTTEPKDDPLADWQANEPSVAGRLTNYQRVSMARVDYRGWDAADWEFTHGSNGTHVLNRNIRVSDARAYALYWSIPESRWAESRSMFDVVAASFQPAAG